MFFFTKPDGFLCEERNDVLLHSLQINQKIVKHGNLTGVSLNHKILSCKNIGEICYGHVFIKLLICKTCLNVTTIKWSCSDEEVWKIEVGILYAIKTWKNRITGLFTYI